MLSGWVTALDPGDLDRQAVESRRRQGLPDYVEDPATIARVVRLILAAGPPSGPPDDLDPGGVEDVATLQAGVQDHPFDEMYSSGQYTVAAIAKILGVSRASIYRHLAGDSR